MDAERFDRLSVMLVRGASRRAVVGRRTSDARGSRAKTPAKSSTGTDRIQLIARQ
jgi:hypothetical protein